MNMGQPPSISLNLNLRTILYIPLILPYFSCDRRMHAILCVWRWRLHVRLAYNKEQTCPPRLDLVALSPHVGYSLFLPALHWKRGSSKKFIYVYVWLLSHMNYCHLIDLGFMGPRFAWISSFDHNFFIQERLDKATMTHLKRLHSVHSPLLLGVDPSKRDDRKRPVRYGLIVSSSLSCCMVLGTLTTVIFFPQIEFFKKEVKNRNESRFGTIFPKIKQLLKRLDGIQKAWDYLPGSYLKGNVGNWIVREKDNENDVINYCNPDVSSILWFSLLGIAGCLIKAWSVLNAFIAGEEIKRALWDLQPDKSSWSGRISCSLLSVPMGCGG